MGGMLVNNVETAVVLHKPVSLEDLADQTVALSRGFREKAVVEHFHLLRKRFLLCQRCFFLSRDRFLRSQSRTCRLRSFLFQSRRHHCRSCLVWLLCLCAFRRQFPCQRFRRQDPFALLLLLPVGRSFLADAHGFHAPVLKRFRTAGVLYGLTHPASRDRISRRGSLFFLKLALFPLRHEAHVRNQFFPGKGVHHRLADHPVHVLAVLEAKLHL